MDTWATSSLTPQIAGKWEDDPDLFARVFPMDLRPQAHDIIRTWLFGVGDSRKKVRTLTVEPSHAFHQLRQLLKALLGQHRRCREG
jgi:valyl-tRNA synthetase